MYYPEFFDINSFRIDMNEYLKTSSLRKMSERIHGQYCPSTLGRIARGEHLDLTTNQVSLICSAMGKKPSTYFKSQLL